MVSCLEITKSVWTLRPLLFTIGIIIGALPVLFLIEEDVMPDRAKRCLYVLIIMGFLWVTETLPVAVTALLPIVLLPMTEVMPAKQVSGSYVNDTTMLFFGGLLVAVAVEEWNLHKRIAILILKGVGSEPKGLMLGLMLPTWFMSMWISNTATTSMMIPIGSAITHQIKRVAKNKSVHVDNSSPIPMVVSTVTGKGGHINNEVNQQADVVNDNALTEIGKGSVHKLTDHQNGSADLNEDKQTHKITVAFTVCIAYAANIGGIATLTGSPPNLIMRGVADDFYRSYQLAAKSNDTSGSGITFTNWMLLALPLSFIALIFAWLILVIVFLTGRGCCTSNPEQKSAIKKIVDKEWKDLGKMTLAECETLFVFVFLVVLWISRDPKESPGWGTWFKSGYVTDSCSSMIMAILLFILPAKSLSTFFNRDPATKKNTNYIPLLTWKRAQEKIPWGVILLVGGGFALANACKDSGLSQWLGDQFAKMDHLEPWAFNMVICFIVAAFTEVTSNTATATILMPILADLGVSTGLNPLYLMITSAIATSFAFMLPVATAPNALVFGQGQIRIIDMASVGFIMNIMAVGVVNLAVNTWGKYVFDFDKFDDIFKATLPVKGSGSTTGC